MSYAILKHQLMDIEVIIKKSIVFAGILAAAVSAIALPFALIQLVIGRALGIPDPFFLMAIGIATAILIYKPVERALVHLTDRYLFQKKEDVRVVFKKLGEEVVRIYDYQTLAHKIIETLRTTLRPESAALLVKKGGEDYEILESFGLSAEAENYEKRDLLISFLKRTRNFVNLSDPKTQTNFPVETQEKLKRLKASLALPLFQEEELIGFLTLGKKLSDADYTAEELEYLPTIANQIAIGLNFSKAIEKQKKILLDYAQQSKLATLGTLTAGIGHEINNPVNNINGSADMLLFNLKRGVYDSVSKEEFIHETKEVLSRVMDNAQRIAGIVKRLSLFSKRPKDFKLETVSPSKVIEDALANVQSRLDQYEVTVKKEYHEDEFSFQADFGSISQSLVALLINGAQAMEKGGEFVLGVRRADAEWGEIYVRDNGCGISKENLDKIFDPFFTTKDTTPDEKGEQGSGLGLYIVQLLIQMNGGKIQVDSVLGEGTSFFLRLPIDRSV